MIFHNRNKNITYAVTRVKQFNFLGRLIDENLNWNAHIDQSCAKLSRAIGILYRLKYIEYQFWKINCFLPVKIFLYTMNPQVDYVYIIYFIVQTSKKLAGNIGQTAAWMINFYMRTVRF